MFDPHKYKYWPMYIEMVNTAASMSTSVKRKVGAVVVTPSGMISIGFNGMPAGMDNDCETGIGMIDPHTLNVAKPNTKPEVIHAERNAIDKMTREGVSTKGSLLFISCAPCLECAKAIHGLGFKAVYFFDHYKHSDGVALLNDTGTHCEMFKP